MDIESASWITSLDDAAPCKDASLVRLHQLLLRVALHEAYRRGPTFRIGGPELDDLAHQAADDAMVALLSKIDTFRGESRFTTWAYRFVALEVANKLGRHFRRGPTVSLDTEQCDQLLARFSSDPLAQTQRRELIAAITQAINETLTDHQRHLFVAIVINGVPTDALVTRSGLKRGAIYKAVFDARRKIRGYLTANGYLDDEPEASRPSDQEVELESHDRVVEAVRTTPGHRSR